MSDIAKDNGIKRGQTACDIDKVAVYIQKSVQGSSVERCVCSFINKAIVV